MAKNIKILGKNIGQKPYDIGFGNEFINISILLTFFCVFSVNTLSNSPAVMIILTSITIN